MGKKKKTAGQPNALQTASEKGQAQARLLAEVGLSPSVANASTARDFAKSYAGDLHLADAVHVLRGQADSVQQGDMSEVEATLIAQAAALDAIFNGLAQRAASNMGQYMNACETYLRLALKAQSQCRATLETLGEIRHPRAPTFVQQQNVAYQQQVNNGDLSKQLRDAPARMGKTVNPTNELLEASHGERLDGGAKGTTGSLDPAMATVEAVARP